MNAMKRWGAIVIVVLGVAGLVLGLVFIMQASSATQKIADELQPLLIAEVDAKYEAVETSQTALAMSEEPGIQAGTASPSAMYNYLSIQRTSLGLARANIGLTGFVRTNGIIDIVVGLGLILAGVGLYKKG